MAELVAEAFLSSLFGVIFEKLGSVDFLDYFRRGKLEKLREKLESTLNSINQVLDDAEEKQYTSQYVKKWLGDVKHFAYEVDQLLDEIDTNAPLKKLKVESSSTLSSFIPHFTNPFESRIKELLNNLVSLAEAKDILGLKPETCARNKAGLNPKPSGGSETTSIVEPNIYGREGDKKEVIMKSTQLHHLKELEDSECWSLFVKHAFHGRNVSDYPNLVSIGKKIVVKCGGLPLAVKTLANLLHRKFTQSEWVKILESDMWCLLDGDGNINPLLRLSYHNLPSNLKRCFAYCSIFPKGHMFYKDDVIKLWMADGLLKCCAADKSEEELGGEVFSYLESISFFQKVMDSEHRFIMHRFIMHDRVNDLAKSASRELCLRIEDDRMQNIPERTRHIWFSIHLKDGEKKLDQVYKIKGLRSLMLKSERFRFIYDDNGFKICKNVQHDIFSRLKHLRMLSFRDCVLFDLADEISNLQLLRYLDLSFTKITRLPNSICKLYNLETLLLKDCELTELPSDFYNLVNLRHLDLRGIDYYMTYMDSIKKMPKHIGRLNNLQTLTNFVVGEQSGSDIKELETLNNLHGTLTISGFENVIDPADAGKAKLEDKKYLEILCIKYPSSDYSTDEMDAVELDAVEMDAVLEALQPNENLKELEIYFFPGKRFPSWLEGYHLPSLVSLHLEGCKFCTYLPPLGQLPSLKELSIKECDGIEMIGEEFCGNNNSSTVAIRSLEILEFDNLSGCKKWLCPEGCFPSLVSLSIEGCGKLKGVELLQHLPPSLQKLEIDWCRELEGSIIPRGGLPSNLSRLKISKCPKLIASREEWGLFQINSLKEFKVSDDFENVESFPEESFLPPNLNSLTLSHCSKLSVINYRGLLHLNSLKSLTLRDCPYLERLPEEGLPNSLSTLKISGCPLLKQQYQKEGGEHWQQISHIPNVIIDYDNQN